MSEKRLQLTAILCWCAIILASYLLIGCGPVYRTQYTFDPPQDRDGRTCVLHCDNNKMQCEHMERMRHQHCEQRADWEQERCEYELERKNKKEKWYSCARSSCSLNLEPCERQYRLCYQNCGGEVVASEICVMNCEAEQQ